MSASDPARDPVDLTGKCLIAMPGMGDPRFSRSLVYLCAHSAEGAMGLIVNKPTNDLRMRDLLDHLSIAPGEAMRNLPVHFGGPVEHGRGFVLPEDVKAIAPDVLRHRILPTYEAEADGIDADTLVKRLLDVVDIT